MSKQLTVGPEPNIKIELVEGDMRLVGWDNDEILVRVDDDAVTLQQNGDEVNITCQDDLSINVPKNSKVQTLTVNGDMSVRGLIGDFEADLVNGDVAMRDAGKVTLSAVESDFSLRGAQGDVRVKSVGGDASLRGVNGSLTLDSVSDDLAIRGVGGNLKVDVEADVVIHLEPKPDQEYSVVAGDDIMLVLPIDASATLTLSADRISINLPGVERDKATTQEVTLGDGSAKINLDAGSRILVSTSEGAAESADEFGNFAGLMFDWGSWGREIGEYWGNFGREMGERMSHRAQETAHRAEHKAQEVARRAERKARRAARRHSAKMKWTVDFDNIPKAPKREPVSEEERMTILRMLAEKKISAEEAEQLLSALEGGK
jgi:hypothetical protein